MSQKKRILEFLKRRKSITIEDALFRMFPAITRLPARIFELNEEGHNIDSSTWKYTYKYKKVNGKIIRSIKTKIKIYKYESVI